MRTLLLLFVTWLFVSCASIKPLEGGAKDKDPPKVVAYFPDSASLNYSGNLVTLFFDEYVKGNNLAQNIIVSPNPATTPEFTIKGKQLDIKFNESLEPNTTYSILLNEAIKDVNEGNTLETAKHLFSTGSFIDSLSVSAVIMNSFRQGPCENCMLFVYPLTDDSAVLREKPIYLNKAGAGGRVTITNLPTKPLRLIAIQDDASNYVLDYGDLISHYATPSFEKTDTFFVFPYQDNRPTKPILLKQRFPFEYQFAFSNTINDSILLTINNDTVSYTSNLTNDTITVIYPVLQDSNRLSLTLDTFNYTYSRYLSPADISNHVKIQFKTRTEDTIHFELNKLGTRIDTSKIHFLIDSNRIKASSVFIKQNELIVSSENFKEKRIKAVFASAALLGTDSTTNRTDTVIVKKIQSHLPDLTIDVKAKDSSQIILQLIDKKDKLVRQSILPKSNSIVLSNINPGSYFVRIISDIDKNGKWTPGDLFSNKQPEPIAISSTFELRLDWDKALLLQL